MADKTKPQIEEELAAAIERAEQAEQDLDDAHSANAELQEQNDKLKAELEARPAVDPEEFAANQEALRLQEEMNVENEERIAQLEAQVAKFSEKVADAKVSSLPRVEVDGKAYQFRAPAAFYDGRKMTAEEMAEDEDLLLELVELGSGILKPL